MSKIEYLNELSSILSKYIGVELDEDIISDILDEIYPTLDNQVFGCTNMIVTTKVDQPPIIKYGSDE